MLAPTVPLAMLLWLELFNAFNALAVSKYACASPMFVKAAVLRSH
jgi:hypothetical protein